MSNSNGIALAPVSIADVKAVLGESSNDLGTLCKSTKINRWARWKPVICASLFSSKEGAGDDGNYGLSVKSVTGDANILSGLYTNQSTNYNYTGKPLGSKSSPYRLADFDKYNHNVKEPQYTCQLEKIVELNDELGSPSGSITEVITGDYVQTASTVYVTLISGLYSRYAVSPTELAMFKDCYFGIALKTPNGSMTVYTTNVKIGTDTSGMTGVRKFSVAMTFSGANQTFTVYPVICNTSGSPVNSNVGTYYPLPIDASNLRTFTTKTKDAIAKEMHTLEISGGTNGLYFVKYKGTNLNKASVEVLINIVRVRLTIGGLVDGDDSNETIVQFFKQTVYRSDQDSNGVVYGTSNKVTIPDTAGYAYHAELYVDNTLINKYYFLSLGELSVASI